MKNVLTLILLLLTSSIAHAGHKSIDDQLGDKKSLYNEFPNRLENLQNYADRKNNRLSIHNQNREDKIENLEGYKDTRTDALESKISNIKVYIESLKQNLKAAKKAKNKNLINKLKSKIYTQTNISKKYKANIKTIKKSIAAKIKSKIINSKVATKITHKKIKSKVRRSIASLKNTIRHHKTKHYNKDHKDKKKPIAKFSVNPKRCDSPCSITLDASASKAFNDKTIAEYSWKLEKNNKITSASPILTHTLTYNKKPHKNEKKRFKDFKLRLRVVDSAGKKSKKVTRFIRVFASTDTEPPVVGPTAAISLSSSSIKTGSSISIDASASTAGDSAITNYSYTFSNGDPAISGTASSTNKSFTTLGSVNITVTVTDEGGLTDSASASLNVLDFTGPTASLSLGAATIKRGESLSLDGSASTIGDAAITNYAFSFSSGEAVITGSSATASQTFNTPGTSTVTLTVTDANNKTSSTSKTVTVTDFIAPTAAISLSATSVKVGTPVTIDASGSTIGDAAITDYTFSFSNGDPSITQSSPSLSKSFTTAAAVTISVLVKDANNKTASASTSLTVTDLIGPTAALSLSANSIKEKSSVTIDASASAAGDSPISEYIFGFSNGDPEVTQSSPVLVKTFNQVGTVTISVEVVDSATKFADASASLTVTALIGPTAALSLSSSSIKQGSSITIDASTSSVGDGAITEYKFSFDNGDADIIQNTPLLTKSFNQVGTTLITLSVTDENAKTSSATASLEVLALVGPSAALSFNPNPADQRAPVTISAAGSTKGDGDIVSYAFSFSRELSAISSAASDQNVTFNEFGPVDVTVLVTDSNGLTSSATGNLVVNEVVLIGPSANFRYLTDAYMGTFEFQLYMNSSAGDAPITSAVYSISTGDTVTATDFVKNAQSLYETATAGIHNVTLTVTDANGLTDSKTYSINTDEFQNAPAINFDLYQSAANTVFLDATKSFDPVDVIEEGIMSIDWGDGSIDTFDGDVDPFKLFGSHLYAVAGTYNISVTLTSLETQLESSLSKSITVSADAVSPLNPIANFRFFDQDFADHVKFVVDGSSSPNGAIVGYNWDMGDGTFETGEEVVHFYTAGIYAVTLTVTDITGATATQSQRVIVFEDGPPVISFADCNFQTGQDFLGECEIYALDKEADLKELRVSWPYGELIIPAANPKANIFDEEINFISGGNFDVTFTAITNRGEEGSYTINANVPGPAGNELPTANLSCVLNLRTVSCDGTTSFDSDGFITNFIWDFGDGTIIQNQGAFAAHTYTGPGEYTVTLSVVDNLGEQRSNFTGISILNFPPVPLLECSSNLPLLSQCNDAGSSDPDGSIVRKTLIYDDGFQEGFVDGIIDHKFQTAGLHSITLEVEDDGGLIAETTLQVDIKPNLSPIANITILNTPPTSQTITFFNGSKSYDPDGQIVSYDWDFGDGSTGAGKTAEHIYEVPGFYTISLVVTDNNGSTTTALKSIEVKDIYPSPIAIFEFENEAVLTEDILSFDGSNSVHPYNDPIVEYAWTFTDTNTTLQGATVSYAFSNVGFHNIVLKVKTGSGLEATKIIDVEVVPSNLPPTIDLLISSNALTTNDTLLIDGSKSTDPNDSIASYQISISGVGTFDVPTINHQFDTEGDYEVTFSVTDTFGATSTKSEIVSVSLYVPEFDSEGVLELTNHTFNSFDELSKTAIFNFTGETFDLNAGLLIEVNEVTVDPVNVVVTPNSIEILNIFVSGLNTIYIEGKDSIGGNFSASYSIYKGSRNATVNLVNSSGNPVSYAGKILARLNSNNTISSTHIINSDSSSFKFLPEGEEVNFIFTDGTGAFGSASYIPNDDSVTLVVNQLGTPSNVDNNNFAQGLDGWEINSPNAFLVPANSRLTPESMMLEATLQPSENSIKIKRTFNVGDLKSISFPFQFSENIVGVEVSVKLVTDGGKADFFLHRIENAQTAGHFNPLSGVKEVGLDLDENDQIVELVVELKSFNTGVTSYLKELGRAFISEAHAAAPAQIFIGGAKPFVRFELQDHCGTKSGTVCSSANSFYKLRHISAGTLPETIDSAVLPFAASPLRTDELGDVFIPLWGYIKLPAEAIFIQSMILDVYVSGGNIPVTSIDCFDSGINLFKPGNCINSFLTDNYKSSTTKMLASFNQITSAAIGTFEEVEIKLSGSFLNQNLETIFFSKEHGIPLKVLIPFISTISKGGSSLNESEGFDFWRSSSPGLSGVEAKISAINSGFGISTGETSVLKLGDWSNLHGGPITEHASHMHGLDVDISPPGYNKGILNKPTTVKHLFETLLPLIEDSDLKAIFYNKTSSGIWRKTFAPYYANKCVKGRIARGYFRDLAKHEEHLHIRYHNKLHNDQIISSSELEEASGPDDIDFRTYDKVVNDDVSTEIIPLAPSISFQKIGQSTDIVTGKRNKIKFRLRVNDVTNIHFLSIVDLKTQELVLLDNVEVGQTFKGYIDLTFSNSEFKNYQFIITRTNSPIDYRFDGKDTDEGENSASWQAYRCSQKTVQFSVRDSSYCNGATLSPFENGTEQDNSIRIGLMGNSVGINSTRARLESGGIICGDSAIGAGSAVVLKDYTLRNVDIDGGSWRIGEDEEARKTDSIMVDSSLNGADIEVGDELRFESRFNNGIYSNVNVTIAKDGKINSKGNLSDSRINILSGSLRIAAEEDNQFDLTVDAPQTTIRVIGKNNILKTTIKATSENNKLKTTIDFKNVNITGGLLNFSSKVFTGKTSFVDNARGFVFSDFIMSGGNVDQSSSFSAFSSDNLDLRIKDPSAGSKFIGNVELTNGSIVDSNISGGEGPDNKIIITSGTGIINSVINGNVDLGEKRITIEKSVIKTNKPEFISEIKTSVLETTITNSKVIMGQIGEEGEITSIVDSSFSGEIFKSCSLSSSKVIGEKAEILGCSSIELSSVTDGKIEDLASIQASTLTGASISGEGSLSKTIAQSDAVVNKKASVTNSKLGSGVTVTDNATVQNSKIDSGSILSGNSSVTDAIMGFVGTVTGSAIVEEGCTLPFEGKTSLSGTQVLTQTEDSTPDDKKCGIE